MNNPIEILPNIWYGTVKDAFNGNFIKSFHIKYLVNISNTSQFPDIDHLNLDIQFINIKVKCHDDKNYRKNLNHLKKIYPKFEKLCINSLNNNHNILLFDSCYDCAPLLLMLFCKKQLKLENDTLVRLFQSFHSKFFEKGIYFDTLLDEIN